MTDKSSVHVLFLECYYYVNKYTSVTVIVKFHELFENLSRVEDAVIRYLNRKPAVGSDAPGST